MICWMSEGITVRAELPSGIDHAAAVSRTRTQMPPFTVFMNYLEEICAFRCDLCPHCMPILRHKGETKGQVPCPERCRAPAVRLSGRQPFCGFLPQSHCLSATPD